MGAEDKARNKIDDLGGKAKEAVGKVTGDKSTENEGKLDQAKSSVKDAAEKVKDAFKQNPFCQFGPSLGRVADRTHCPADQISVDHSPCART